MSSRRPLRGLLIAALLLLLGAVAGRLVERDGATESAARASRP